MEIKLESVLLKDGITGIYDKKDIFISLFKEDTFNKESVFIDSKKLTKQEKSELYKDMSIIDDITSIDNYNMTVYEYLKKVILDESLNLRNYHKKISDSMKIINFSDKYLNKSISELSRYEKIMIVFVGKLLKNPKIIVFNNFFRGVDFKNTKTIMRLIGQMVDKYRKKVIICSTDVNLLYNNTENIIIYSDNKVLIQGKTNCVFEEEKDTLGKNEIPIPYSIQFVSKSRSRGINLNYNKDIRDLIKDIYKKV